MKKVFVQSQGQVLQGGTALAPMGRPAPTWPLLSFGLGAVQLRAEALKASCLSVLHSEAFSIAIGFISAVVMLASIWALLWIVSIMLGG